MALLEMIAEDTTSHTTEDVARILADADCDLSDDDRCLDVLVAAGIRPWQFRGHWIEAKCEAHNIRTFRLLMKRYLAKVSAAAVVLLLPFVLAGLALSGLASPAEASGHGTQVLGHVVRGLCVLLVVCLAGAFVVAYRDGERRHGRR